MATSARTPTSPHTRAGGSGAATLPVTPMRTPGGSVAASSKATAGDGSLLSSSTTKGSGAGGGAGVAPAATAAQAAGGAAAAKAAAAAAAASKQFTLESCWVTNSDLPPTSFQRVRCWGLGVRHRYFGALQSPFAHQTKRCGVLLLFTHYCTGSSVCLF